MSRYEELAKISTRIEKALRYYSPKWEAHDTALIYLCRPLPNKNLETVLPKVVSIDRLYKADLIRYLAKPKDNEHDTRPSYYADVARAITKLDLDKQIKALNKQGTRLGINCLDVVVSIHGQMSVAVQQVIGRNADVFASKYLHFCRQEYFPMLDSWAEQTACDILDRTDEVGNYIIIERFGYNDLDRSRYDYFCRAVLAIQSALGSIGLGQFTLPEMDRYLYGYER